MCLWLAVAGVPAVHAVPSTPLPAAVLEAEPALALVGKSRFRKFLIHVYDARLWAPAGDYRPDAVVALDLTYARAFESDALATRSVQEMAGIGAGSEAQRAQWAEQMREVFPDVAQGDRLIGLYEPGGASRFYLNGKLYSQVDDPAFGEAFFGIWLNEATSEPALREALIAQR
ncbi:MAG: chalcone isomerase family protein [Pseudomonadota bacterium]|nr:chalcone isomerase family protein [Pseudomonadota bacterium]HJO34712.1 chalcone isomerase family protein [Gammaproteobacteria bacterium]